MTSMSILSERFHDLTAAASVITQTQATDLLRNDPITYKSLAMECFKIDRAIVLLIQKLSMLRQVKADASAHGKSSVDNCSICIEPLYPETSVKTTTCQHPFHLHCILEHLGILHGNSNFIFCPLCREPIEEEADVLNAHNGFENNVRTYGKGCTQSYGFYEAIDYLFKEQVSAFKIIGAIGCTCLSAGMDINAGNSESIVNAIKGLREIQARIVEESISHLIDRFEIEFGSKKLGKVLPQNQLFF